jgi:signal transduction histidine kinase
MQGYPLWVNQCKHLTVKLAVLLAHVVPGCRSCLPILQVHSAASAAAAVALCFQAAAQVALRATQDALVGQNLRDLMATKDRLVYSLSHELRAPINGIIGKDSCSR